MEELTLCGFRELSEEHKAAFVAHLMDKDNWARKVTKKAKKAAEEGAAAAAIGGGAELDVSLPRESGPSLALAVAAAQGGRFVLPQPGVNGAVFGALNGQTFVLTGTFPEVGGGSGLNLGKDRCIQMLESFGGRVMGSVSGKTSYLVVGKAPGASKVSAAHAKGVRTIDVMGLKRVLETPGAALEDAPAAVIGEFSAGFKAFSNDFKGNGIGRLLEPADAAALRIKAPRKPKAKKAVKKKEAEPRPKRKRKGGE